jgi:hypothetical protein
MMARPPMPMPNARAASLLVLAAGLGLVFAGLSAAFAYSLSGMVASGALMGALLYAGGVWLGAPPPRADPQVLLFTRALAVASGPSQGRPLRELFPAALHAAIEQACRDALEGRAARLTPSPGSTFAVSPVRSPEGAVVYGLLLTGRVAEAAADVTPAF